MNMFELDAHVTHGLTYALYQTSRLISGDGEDDHGSTVDSSSSSLTLEDEHSSFGVHITFDDLYHSVVFFAMIYIFGKFAAIVLRMPTLVGEIIAGVVLGPYLLNFVPNPTAFVMLGEIGLILLVLEAGIDIDLATIRLIGGRGVLIAVVGSVLPIAIAVGIAFALGTDVKGSISAGCCFGPTSLGIAMNILRGAKIINTPVGQMIVAAAIIDDMIALIILSQLNALVGTITVAGVLIPIVSALGFLVIGGLIAVFVFPNLFERLLLSRVPNDKKGYVSLGAMFLLLIALMPATYYSKASYLMGAFIAGLGFCDNHEAHVQFVSQFKRLLQWLMRIFFAASIGFQVPITHFANGTVIWQGLLFLLALLGKIAVGFMVPNFTPYRRYTNLHLRDCLVVSFSMAAEGEFAFVIAVFAVDKALITQDLYASIVLAVLLSTILAPFGLKLIITMYNKKEQDNLRKAEEIELKRSMSILNIDDIENANQSSLKRGISKSTVFVCIQTQSDSQWGLLYKLMNTMGKLKLEIIDHRTWNPRGINTTLVNEIYAKDSIQITNDSDDDQAEQSLNNRLIEIQKVLLETIKQPDRAKVKVHRWFPGVIEEIVEEIIETEEDGSIVTKTLRKVNLKQEIASEAATLLEKKKEMQLKATKERDVKDILGENGKVDEKKTTKDSATSATVVQPKVTDTPATTRRIRVRTMSTPVIGGDLFASEPVSRSLNSSITKSTKPLPSIDESQDVEVQLPSTLTATTTVTPAQPSRKIRIKSKSTNALGGGLFGEESKSSSSSTVGGGEMSLNLQGPLFKYSKHSVPAKDVEAQLIVDGKNYNIVLNRTALSRIIRDTETVQRLSAEQPARLSNRDLRYRGAREKVPLDTVLEGIVRRDTTDRKLV